MVVVVVGSSLLWCEGTLCHIMAEGEDYWYRHSLSKEQRVSLLKSIAAAVSGWNKATERWINYRSLRPIINLLRPGVDHEVYLWATWALLSLYVEPLCVCVLSLLLSRFWFFRVCLLYTLTA